jgi:hypothetical protein
MNGPTPNPSPNGQAPFGEGGNELPLWLQWILALIALGLGAWLGWVLF